MELYLSGLIVSLLSFLLQVWPRLFNRYFGIDTWRHLLLADYVRKTGKIPENLTKHYITPSGHPGYPPVIIYYISLFPKEFAEKYQFILSPVLDFFHNYLIFLTTLIITNNLVAAISAQIIAMLTPIIVIEASNLSTRVISYVVFSLSFLPLLLYFSFENSFLLILAFIFLVVLFFTHKFAIQVYFFLCVAFSLLLSSLFFIEFFVVAFLFVYFILRKNYRPILNEHLKILNFWRKNINFRLSHQFRNIHNDNAGDFVHKMYTLSFKNPLIYIIGNNPWIVIFFALLLLNYSGILTFSSDVSKSSLGSYFYLWFFILFCIALIVLSVKPLRFLGEGNRYIEYAVFPLSVLIGTFIPGIYNKLGVFTVISFILVCLIFFLIIIYLQIKVIVKDKTRTITPQLWEIIHILNSEGKKVRLGIFPLQFGDAMTYFLKGKILTTYNNAGLEYLSDIYPKVKLPMTKIIQKFRLNYILFDESYVSINELKISKYKIVYREKDTVLLKV